MSGFDNFQYIIAEERRRAKMTQETLARALGVTPQAVSKWENGIGYPGTFRRAPCQRNRSSRQTTGIKVRKAPRKRCFLPKQCIDEKSIRVNSDVFW